MTANVLVELFRLLTDPNTVPSAAVRARILQFRRDYVQSKTHGNLEECEALLLDTARRDPAAWPESEGTLHTMWRQMRMMPETLPPLTRPAQLIWLGVTLHYPADLVDEALARQFALSPIDEAKAYREAAEFFKIAAVGAELKAAISRAWAEVHKARGRPESEFVFGNCLDELGIVEERDGTPFLNPDRLRQVADRELRHATLAAAWKCIESMPSWLLPQDDA